MPEKVAFRTKPQLARRMLERMLERALERALESGVPFGWVTGDEVYGNDRRLRLWLERRDVPHVPAVRSNEKLWAKPTYRCVVSFVISRVRQTSVMASTSSSWASIAVVGSSSSKVSVPSPGPNVEHLQLQAAFCCCPGGFR